MTLIKTLDGRFFEVPECAIASYRVPDEVASRHQARVPRSLQRNLAAEFSEVQAAAASEQVVSACKAPAADGPHGPKGGSSSVPDGK